MKVSFVIPAYNAEKTLVKCIKDILKISKYEIEIIVVNDGSRDKTIEECKKINDERLKVFSKENGGVSSARNYGMQRINGEYVMFCDADDSVQAHAMEKVLDALEQNEFVMFNIAKNDDGHIKKEKMKLAPGCYENKEGKLLEKYVLDVPLYKKWPNNILQGSVWRFVYKVDFLKKNGIIFDEEIPYAEDLCFCIECFERVERFGVVDEVAYIANIIPGTASRRFRPAFWRELQTVYKRICQITGKENEVLYCHYGRSAILHYLLNQNFSKGYRLCESVLNDERFIHILKKISFNEKIWDEKIFDKGCIENKKLYLCVWSCYWRSYYYVLKKAIIIKKKLLTFLR